MKNAFLIVVIGFSLVCLISANPAKQAASKVTPSTLNHSTCICVPYPRCDRNKVYQGHSPTHRCEAVLEVCCSVWGGDGYNLRSISRQLGNAVLWFSNKITFWNNLRRQCFIESINVMDERFVFTRSWYVSFTVLWFFNNHSICNFFEFNVV